MCRRLCPFDSSPRLLEGVTRPDTLIDERAGYLPQEHQQLADRSQDALGPFPLQSTAFVRRAATPPASAAPTPLGATSGRAWRGLCPLLHETR